MIRIMMIVLAVALGAAQGAGASAGFRLVYGSMLSGEILPCG